LKYTRLFLLILCTILLLTVNVFGESDKKVVMIVVNEVNFDDLKGMPTVRKLIEGGAIGLMNNRTSTRSNTYKAYTTIGAGVRAEASADTTNFTTINKEIKSTYQRRTGYTLPDSGIVNIDIAKLIKQNNAGEYGAVPGALGQALREVGMKTAVIGNSDIPDTSISLGAAIAMDNKGYVDYGNIGKEILTKNDSYPFGIKTDYIQLEESFKDFYQNATLVVIDLGDIGRLERYKDNMSDLQYEKTKNIILMDMDKSISSILDIIDLDRTRVMIVTPYPSSKDLVEGRRLSPVLVYGSGISRGLLYSDTTRRNGIVGNIDISASVLQYLGVDSGHLQGRPFHYISKEDNFNTLMNLENQVVNTSINRSPVLSAFALYEIIVSIFALVILLIDDKYKKMVPGFKAILLSTMIVPFILLIVPLFQPLNLFLTYTIIISITGTIAFLINKFCEKKLDAVIIVSGATTLTILADLLNNSSLMKTSLLGYDPIIGARYYGLGNEYMGIFIAAALVFACALLDRFKINIKWIMVFFLLAIIVIGFPKLGANVGGTITAVVAFTFTLLRLYKIKIKLKQFAMIGMMVFGVVFIMAFIDIKLTNGQSHLAGAVNQMFEVGPEAIFLIIERKLAMNLRLIGVTIWSRVLLTAIIIMAIMFYRPVKLIERLVKLYPNLSIGWSGIVAACIVGFAVNDSGIVVAATSVIFLAMSMLYLSFTVPKQLD